MTLAVAGPTSRSRTPGFLQRRVLPVVVVSLTALALWYLAAVGMNADLQRDVAVLLGGAVCDHLALIDLQHGDRHVLAGLREDPGHADLLCNDA